MEFFSFSSVRTNSCLRCKDKKGTFTVETTAWEKERAKADGGLDGTKPRDLPKPHQWSSNWHDPDEASP